jgi:hypothetical protein
MSSNRNFPVRLDEILANAAAHSIAREHGAMSRHVSSAFSEQLIALATDALGRHQAGAVSSPARDQPQVMVASA